MKVKNMQQEVEIPEGVECTLAGSMVTIKGPKGENKRDIYAPYTTLEKKENKIIISAKNATKREKTLMGTLVAHLKNMIKGVSDGFVYKLKICSGHFPMNVSVSGNEFIIKNFLGEKNPRVVKIKEGVTVKVNGQEIIVESINKELAGQTAATIELSTKIKGRDRRIFQDGIYIIQKDNKVLA